MQSFENNIALAERAAERGDWDEALRYWALVAQEAPLLPVGWIGASQALIGLGRPDEAEAVLVSAAERFPSDAATMVDYASIAMRRADWGEALRRCGAVREKFPDDPGGHINVGIALRELGRLDESDTVLSAAIERFPDNRWAMIHRACNAMRRQDWEDALRRYRAISERFSDEPEPLVEAGAALRELGRLDEADAVLIGAMERFPDNRWAVMHHARVAMRRQDWAGALRRWQTVQELFSDDAAATIEAACALLEMGRLDEAEEVLSAAVERFPDNFDARSHHASAAGQLGNWAMAAARWEIVARQFPHLPAGHAGVGGALLKLGRAQEAERILAAAVERFPENAEIASHHASAAYARADWSEALRRSEAVQERFPAEPAGYWGILDALRKAPYLAGSRDDPVAAGPLPTFLAKPDALMLMAHRAGVRDLSGLEQRVAATLGEIAQRCAPIRNAGFRITDERPGGLDHTRLHQAASRTRIEPFYTNGRPDCFPEAGISTVNSPEYNILSIPGGSFASFLELLLHYLRIGGQFSATAVRSILGSFIIMTSTLLASSTTHRSSMAP